MAETQAVDTEDRTPTVEELAQQMQELQSEVRDANQSARSAKMKLLDLREEVAEKDERIDDLEERVEEQAQTIEQLRDRTGLLETVKRGSSLPIEQRAAVLVQTLYNKAAKDGKAAMDYKAAEAALGGSVNRASIMRTFDKAEALVGNDDLVWKQAEDRSSKKNTRLILDLEGGDLPATIAGETISPAGGR